MSIISTNWRNKVIFLKQARSITLKKMLTSYLSVGCLPSLIFAVSSTNREACLLSRFPMWQRKKQLSPFFLEWAFHSSVLIIMSYFLVRWLNSLQSDFVGGFIGHTPGTFGWFFVHFCFFLLICFPLFLLDLKLVSLKLYWQPF